MAEIQSNIQVNLDASQALAQLKTLQRQLANFHTSIAATTAASARAQANLQDNLIHSINATGKFSASLQQIKGTSEAFTESLEKNKFSTREYFRYAGGATKTFGRLFKSEFNTIQKVAEERVKTMQTQYVKMGRAANGALKAIAIRPLTLDMENFATKTAIAAQKQQILNQLLTQGSTKLLNFGKNTQWAGRQLMVGFTIPLVMLGSQAGKTFMALEKQAIRFKRVYGEMFTTADETDKALKSIELLAKEFTKYGVAVEKTMEMAADAAATGKMGADLTAQVAEATRLAVLGGVEQKQALETTISLTNAFGIAADDLNKKINFLNAVENQTVLSIEDLTIAIPKAAPVIRQLGGNVEDLAFFMTAMKEGGINASEGANALKSGLAALINPSKKAKAFLQDFGISIDKIVESNKGDIKTTVLQFAQALDTLDPLNRARAIEQLFGKFQFSRLSTLFQNITKDGTQASRTLKLTSASVEELAILSERELKKVEDATGTKFKKSLEDLKLKLVPLGEQFLKAVTPIAEFFGKILNGFNNLSDGVKSGITKFIGVVGVIGPVLLMTFGLVANGIANLIKLFVALRKGYMGLGGQSKILGNQTQYMTSEQIEAATVAASLDQAHSKLKQTFMMEKDALVILTQAYQRASAAAAVFARANPGAMRPGFKGRPPVPPMKLNSGGFVTRAGGTVPGTGNTDTVPAMLTPGEFVVNKQATQANKGLLQKLNSGGFVLRGTGSPGEERNVRVGGVAGTALLHYDDATSNQNVPTHQQGRLKGYRKASGYLMLGDQGYNNLTNSASRGKSDLYRTLKLLPSPYPLTLQDAKASKVIIDSKIEELKQKVAMGKKLNAAESKLFRMLNVSSLQIRADLKNMPNGSMWRVGMAQRTAMATALAEGEGYPPPGPQYKRTFSAFLNASRGRSTTAGIKLAYTKQIDQLWKSNILKDEGMGGDKSREHGKKGTLHSRPKTPVEKFMSKVAEKRSYKSIKGLTRVGTGPKGERGFIENAVTKALTKRGFVVQRARATGTPQYGEPQTTPALVTPGEMVLNEKTTRKYGTALQYVNSGGIIKMRGKGTMKNGIVPGVGNKDTVPMMLNEGSFVVNKKATQKNRGFLNTIAMRAKGTSSNFVMRALGTGGTQVAKSVVVNSEDQRIASEKQLLEEEARRKKAAERAQQNLEKARNKIRTIDAKIAEATKAGDKQRVEALKQARQAALQEQKRAGVALNNARQQAKITRENAAKVTQQKIQQAQDDKKNQKMMQKERGRQFGQRAGGTMMGATMALGMMTQVPGKVGEVSQSLLPAVGMASMIAPMIGSTSGAIIAPIAAFTAAMVGLRMQFDKAQDAALELSKATGTSTKAIQGFAEFAGRVTGTELLDRQRLAARGQLVAATGKTTFGEAFVQSEQGKALGAAFKENIKQRGTKAAAQDLKAQLQTSVLSGAITAEEAQSIAANLGAQMGDATIGIQVAGELQGIFGKDGKDITKNGIQIRTRLMTESSQKFMGKNGSLDQLKKGTSGGFFGMAGLSQTAKVGGAVAYGAGAGALIGSAILPGVGTLVGTAIGAIVGGISSYFGNKKTLQRLGKLSGAAVADATNMFEQSRQLLDSYEAEYKQRRAQLILEGKIAQVKALDMKYEKNRGILAAQQTKQREDFLKTYATTRGNARTSMVTALDKQITRKYKGTDQEAYVGAAREMTGAALNKGLISNEQTALLKVQIASGEISPRDAMKIFQTFENKQDVQRVMTVLTKLGGDETSAAMDVVSQFQDANGNPIPKLNSEFILQLSQKGDKDAQPFIEMMQKVTALGGVLKMDTEIDYLLKNPQIQKEMTKDLQMIADNKGKPFTVEFLNKVNTEFSDTMSMDYFKKLSDNEKEVYVRTISTLLNIDDEVIFKDPDFLKWQKEPGALGGAQYSGKSKAFQRLKYIEATAQKVTNITADTSVAPTAKNTGGGGGKRDTTFDEMNKKLKLFQQASVNALGKFKELQKVINAPGNKGGAFYQFNGISQQLARTGQFSEEFINMIENLSPEELQNQLKKWGIVIDKGVVKTKNAADIINKALSSIGAGELDANNLKQIGVLQNRIIAVNKLRKQGIDYATAMSITENDSIALSIRKGEVDAKRMKDLIASTKTLQRLQMKSQQIDEVKSKDPAAKQAGTMEKLIEFFDLQTKAVQAGNVIQKTAIELQQEKNGYLLEQINYEQSLINDVYDKQIEKLDAMYAIQEQINQTQRERFDLAQQLASGDIAGAAKAMQDMRERQALAQIEQRKANLEKERQKRLEGVTAGGKTQKQIETENALADKNLSVIKTQEFDALQTLRKEFEKILGTSVEQANALVDLESEASQLGFGVGKKLGAQLKDALTMAVSGNVKPLLELFKKGTMDVYDEFRGKPGQTNGKKIMVGGQTITVPEQSVLDYLNVNTTELGANTSALKALTQAITGTGIGKVGSNVGGGAVGGSGGKGGSSSVLLKPENPRQAEKRTPAGRKPETIRQGERRTVLVKPETVRQAEKRITPKISPVIPRQAIAALAPDLDKRTTVSGSDINISVQENPDVNKKSIALIEQQQKFIEDQKQSNIEQLAASKNAERSAANSADAVNRMSPMAAEMMGIFNSTMQLLGNNAKAKAKKQDTVDVTNILNNKAASNAREAQIADKAALTLPQAIAAANEAGRSADRVATAEIVAQKTAETNNKNLLGDKQLSSQMFDIYTGVLAQREGLNQAAYASDKKLSQDMLTIASNVTAQRTGLNQAAAASDKKLSGDMFAIYNEVLAQRAGLNQAAYAEDKKFSTTSVASGINKGSIRAIEGPGPSKIDLLAGVKKQESAKSTAISNINSPLKLAESRATTQFNALYGPLAGVSQKYLFKNTGGIIPKYFASGGYERGTDTIPAMLTPGEFVVQKRAVDELGISTMNRINQGELPASNNSAVYNYNLSVNVSNTNANPNDIARTVINQIKQIDSQRIRSYR